MARAVLVLVTVGVTIYAIVDCLRSHPSQMRGLPKPIWVLVCLVLPPVGALVYLVFGRVDPEAVEEAPRHPHRILAPDDDPEFLRSLGGGRPRDGSDTPPHDRDDENGADR
jgi:hypothetical protein